MATATTKDAKKSPIPKRILTRIDAAFNAHSDVLHDIATHSPSAPNDGEKARKKAAKDKAEVVAYIEALHREIVDLTEA